MVGVKSITHCWWGQPKKKEKKNRSARCSATLIIFLPFLYLMCVQQGAANAPDERLSITQGNSSLLYCVCMCALHRLLNRRASLSRAKRRHTHTEAFAHFADLLKNTLSQHREKRLWTSDTHAVFFLCLFFFFIILAQVFSSYSKGVDEKKNSVTRHTGQYTLKHRAIIVGDEQRAPIVFYSSLHCDFLYFALSLSPA